MRHVESFNPDDYIRQAAAQMGDTKLWARLSEGDKIAREAYYNEHCMKKFGNKFRKFSNDHVNHVKDVQKSLEAIAVAQCMLFIKDSLQSSDEVAPFIKLSVIRKFYCHCLESTRRISSCDKTATKFIKT